MQSIITKAMKKISLILGMTLALSPTAMGGNDVSAVDVIGRLAAEKPMASVGVAERSSVLGSLALLPADTETYVSLVNFSQSVHDIMALFPDAKFDSELQRVIFSGIRDITISSGKGTTAWLKPFIKFLSADALSSSLNGDSKGGIRVNWKDFGAQLPAPGKGLNMVVEVTLSDELMGLWKGNEEQLKLMLETMPSEGSGVSRWSGRIADISFWGVKVDILKAVHIAGGLPSMMDDSEYAEFEKVWKERALYAALATEGNRLILVIAEDPARQNLLAKTPSKSVLSTKDMAMLDARLNKDIRFVYHVDEEARALSTGMWSQNVADFNKALSTGVGRGSAWGKVMAKLINIIGRQATPIASNESLNMVAWKENGVRISYSNAATSLDGVNAPLTLLPMASANPNAFLYTEGAMSSQGAQIAAEATGCVLSELPNLLQDGDFLENVLDMTEQKAKAIAEFSKTHSKELNALCGETRSLLADMGERRAFVVETADGVSPEVQVSFLGSCSDRAKTEADWMKFCASLAQFGVAVDGYASFAEKAIAIGSSEKQNAKTVGLFSAGKAPLTGNACVFRPTLLKKYMPLVQIFGGSEAAEFVQWLDGVMDGIYTYATNDGKTVRGEVYVKAK